MSTSDIDISLKKTKNSLLKIVKIFSSLEVIKIMERKLKFNALMIHYEYTLRIKAVLIKVVFFLRKHLVMFRLNVADFNIPFLAKPLATTLSYITSV